jgi:hypothetical protein
VNPSYPNVRDASLTLTLALPAASAGTATSASLDMGATTGNGELAGDFEFLLSAPALSSAQAPNGATFTYAIVGSANANLSSPTPLAPALVVQTGAGGAGAAAASQRYRPPSNAPRYIGFTVAPSAGNADASAASATMAMLF